ncbi:MAG: hypothetical protein A2W98_04800 [Bacteroidetes bacterium GWF2_33_38]|nr:MAG: hypothetical protein A2W98_04800 [Bacteroidetes bacterium GWF2_33_38]OFY76155.1 MAG: hypothetical protein A2265_07735 [Bacteroidetes bacterium RIFOXYA12_FULL_33_9]OFY91704.1 MAG: hypothetical protein A2236_07170 [Bacteroidetes bacterium RIFOXYA2_FULL_33_7]
MWQLKNIKNKHMKLISFGEYIDGKSFKVVDERQMRGSAGIMLLLGIIAFINGFIIKNYSIIPYISGFLALNFMIGIFVNPKFSPTILLARLFTWEQSAMPIGAVQKKFAWSLGLSLSIGIFILSLYLLNDVKFFEPVCMLCLICLLFLYLETAFGICVGCKLYFWSIRLKLIPKPTERPNCMGNSCEV